MTRTFRLGTTSFVYRDGWLGNVERLAGRVDDVEILLFDVDAERPADAELEALAAVKARAGLSYTVHTPLDASLASEDEVRRRASVAKVLRALALGRPLSPHAFILHVYLGDHEGDRPPADLAAWRRRAHRSLDEILDASGLPAHALCVEWLDYDLALLEPVLHDLGLPVALDAGHLQRDGLPLEPVLERLLPRTRVIQWHGVDPSGRDHRSLAHLPAGVARRLLDALVAARWSGVLTLEVFREADFEESLALVHRLLGEGAAC